MNQKQLKEYLSYDHMTGIFHGRKSGLVLGKQLPDGYIWIWINGNKYRADKLAWLYCYGVWPTRGIAHKDNDKTHNAMINLTKPQMIKRHKRGITGVFWVERDQHWQVKMYIDGKQRYLGSSKNFDEAVWIRAKAENEKGIVGSPAQQHVKKIGLIENTNIPGVNWSKNNKRWVVTFRSKYLGSSKDFDEAVELRARAENKKGTPAQRYIESMNVSFL